MGEKVLGFRKKDAVIWQKGVNYNKIPHMVSNEYRIKERKLVPVVSVEEIRRMQKRWDKNENCPFTRKDPELCNKNQTCVYCVLERLRVPSVRGGKK